MRPLGTPTQLEARRRQAIRLLQKGYGTREIAAQLHVDPRSVRRWRSAHRRRGEAGIRAQPARGRTPKLNARQRQALRTRLLKGARANGYPTDLWTCPRTAPPQNGLRWLSNSPLARPRFPATLFPELRWLR